MFRYSYQTGSVSPALFGPKVCWVSQLASGSKNGYGHGRPPIPGTNGAKPMKQKLHRMAILAWHDTMSFQLLMFRQSAGDDGRYDASHLCGNARCFRPDHLVVEEHGVNEGQKVIFKPLLTLLPQSTSIPIIQQPEGLFTMGLESADHAGKRGRPSSWLVLTLLPHLTTMVALTARRLIHANSWKNHQTSPAS